MYTGRSDNSDEDNTGYVYDNYGMQNQQQDNEEQVEQKGFENQMQIEQDIFTFKNIDLQGIAKTEKIKKFIVSQETRILLTENNTIYRWRIKIDPEFKSFSLPDSSKDHFLGLLSFRDKQLTVKNIYLDPKGYHCIIIAQGGNNFYLNFKQTKIRILKQLKGIIIRTLNFHSSVSQNRSGDIILSLQKGAVALYRVGIVQNQIEQIIVLQLQLAVSTDVISIEILKLKQQNQQNYVIVLFSTISAIFCITGPDDLEVLMNGYKNQIHKIQQKPMPKGYQCLIHTSYSKVSKRPTNILWTNGNKLLRFRVPDKNEVVNDNFFNKNEPFKFAKKIDLPDQKAFQVQQHPTNIGITDFHYYILFQQSITIISNITQKIVLNKHFEKNLVLDMAYERNTGVFWIYSKKEVIKLDTSRQGTQAWKLLLLQKKYQLAYQVCKQKNQNVSYVAGIYADNLFRNKKYIKAAGYFCQTKRSFEEIFLKFLQANCDQARQGLEIYLKGWMNQLTPDQRSQRVLLISWLIELIVYRLNNLDRQKVSPEQKKANQAKKKLKQLQLDLQQILNRNLDIINQDLVYLIMQSHGRIQNLINFASKKHNFEMIVMHYLSQENYQKALIELENVKNPKVVDVIYKYSHIFFRYETQKTVLLLTRIIRDFKPIKLMPGLMNIPDIKRNYGIDLLKYCIEQLRSRQKSLHNILIFFYSTTNNKEKIPQLILLIRKGRLDFDLDFGLRLFKTYKIYQAQIMVYGKMYLYAQAVSLALQNNKQDLAKQYADKPQYQDQRKKLWIEIAKHYLVKKGNISQVIELTKQSKVVKIEDLLPYFNQNIKIENFKDQICDSLKIYSQEITRLKSLMESYSSNAQQLKSELRVIKNRCIEIDSNHKCQQCYKVLFSTEFYIFPCMHGFHRQCLYDCIKMQLGGNRHYQIDRIMNLHEEIRLIESRISGKIGAQQSNQSTIISNNFSFMNAFNLWSNNKKQQENSNIISPKQQIQYKNMKKEFQQLMASECIYCGPGIVDIITMPFENQIIRDSWRI